MPTSPPSEREAMFYYLRLPSAPRLVARTGTTLWKEPTGRWASYNDKDLRVVGNHPIKDVWEDNLALKVMDLLDSMKVKWTSLDVVRIGIVEEDFAPVILWIGVIPTSLSGEEGVIAAYKCHELLVECNITDVDVQIRESVVTRSGGPKLLKPARYSWKPTVAVREPLTTMLGLPICAESMPWCEGTGGFFITEGGNTERLLLVTARHVIFTPDMDENKHLERTDDREPGYNVMLFGDTAFNKYLEVIKNEIRGQESNADYYDQCIAELEGRDDPEASKERQRAQDRLLAAKEAMEALNPFYQNVATQWATPDSRILGQVILSPPINAGEGYTEDWAVIEIDTSKIDASNFEGNAIDLGTRISIYDLIRMMNPKPPHDHPFEYPFDRLLRLEGTIPDEEMRHPTVLDKNNEPCLMVLKRGNTTGLTVGRANNVFSYARNDYHNDEKAETSKEWAILPFDSKSHAFSETGDSGSVIVDGLGRIGGLLTGGSSAKPSEDINITYAIPISFLLKRMQENGLRELNFNPVLTTQTRSSD
ncbi:unnamed protein product [Cyclocybe aegerita]|uniref:Serine protease n=1 Tax=Cyclocybe aegerita TaxID=1973307 RepID=A0A8S0XPZ0_CYCAE|nr:unnamed protein product [Cyclocybe aegerita]